MAGDYHDDYYVNLLDKNQAGFLRMLNRNIIKGDKQLVSKEETMKMLRVISHHPLCQQLLFNFRDDHDDDCLIHNVAKFHQSHHVLKYLLDICPRALLAKRTDRFAGQTALHIVVTKGNFKATRTILKSNTANGNDQDVLLHTKATGSLFANTVMMGELALSVAALTLNTRITDLLMKHGARVSEQNSRGDTVFHSLIRFAVIHPEKLDSTINMIEHINSKLSPDLISLVWYNSENSQNLTALKLAASLGQVEIFSSILKLENVYCKLNHHDGLFDIYLFDITEIDTITQAEWERNKKRERKLAEKSKSAEDKGFSFKQEAKKKQPAAQSHRPALIHTCPSVLDIICRMPTATAFQLMNVDVVNDVIKTKWTHYRKFYYLWLLVHFLLMSVITAYAVYKTEVINDNIYSDKTNNNSNSDSFDTNDTTKRFVYGTSFLCVIYATPYLVYEAFRSFYFRQAWHLDVIHHNGLYRLMLMTMSVSLVIDSVLFWIEPDNNYFLVVALLIGWTFMNFFLRALKIFSFFTVMLQKVLLGDMTRFSVIIIFQLIAFSFAMYITFLNTNPVPDGFESIGQTMMTMFKLMLGLTDIEVLYEARHPWMAIFLFISCVLVTYVLLINSLIALMSQTCALVSEDRRMQWELQRLSVIHLVETMLFPRWRYLHKPGLKARRYNLDSQALEWRCFNEITSIQTTYTDGAALFRRKSMIRTIGFGDSAISPMAPFIDRFRAGSGRHTNLIMNTLAPIYQSPASLREVGTIAEEENQDLDQDSSEDETSTNLQNAPISIPTPVPVKDKMSESSSDKGSSSKMKQTRLHSSTDNVRSEMPTLSKKQRHASDEYIFSSLSSSSAFGEETTSTSNNKFTRTSKENRQSTPDSSSNKNKKNQHHHHQFLKPEATPSQLSPRKRHNSERINRKTQTVSQGGDLSHSYPDSGLRTPLRQHRHSVGEQTPYNSHSSTSQQAAAVSSDINPRIVYVVPSSAMFSHQQPMIPGILTDPTIRQFPAAATTTNQENQILHQIAAVPGIRFPPPPPPPPHQEHREQAGGGSGADVYAQVVKPRGRPAPKDDETVGVLMKTVQKLDIDTVQSSA